MTSWKDVLKTLNIVPHMEINHGPVMTVDEMMPFMKGVPGMEVKNLFVKEKKTGQYFLISAHATSPVELNPLAKRLGFKAFRFASEEELIDHLGVKAGCVTPLAVVNDTKLAVKVFFDSRFKTEEYLVIHGVEPDFNASSFCIKVPEVLAYMKHVGHDPEWIDL